MKQVFDDPNTELFLRMTNLPCKPAWVNHLESVGIEVNPRAYLSQEFIDKVNNA